jgi:DNA-binding HxlR family transcriptional regulator
VVTTDRQGDLFSPACPTRQLLDRLGTKWVSMAVKVLHDAGTDDAGTGEVRFAELRRRMPGVSQKMLSQTLRSLVADGIVHRRVEDCVPPAVHYSLTPLGRSLDEPLEVLRRWAETHMAEIDDRRRAAARPAVRADRS